MKIRRWVGVPWECKGKKAPQKVPPMEINDESIASVPPPLSLLRLNLTGRHSSAVSAPIHSVCPSTLSFMEIRFFVILILIDVFKWNSLCALKIFKSHPLLLALSKTLTLTTIKDEFIVLII